MSQEYIDKIKFICFLVATAITALGTGITFITFITSKSKLEEFRKDPKHRKQNLLFFIVVCLIFSVCTVITMPNTNDNSNPKLEPKLPPRDTSSKEPEEPKKPEVQKNPEESKESSIPIDSNLQIIATLSEESQEIETDVQKIQVFVPLPREGYGLLIVRAENPPHDLSCIVDSGYYYWLYQGGDLPYAEKRFELKPGFHLLRFTDKYGLIYKKQIKIAANNTYLKEFTHLYPYGVGIGRLVISPLKNVPCLVKFEYSRDNIVEYLIADKPLSLDLKEGTYDLTFVPKIESKLKLDVFKRVEIGAGHFMQLEIGDRE